MPRARGVQIYLKPGLEEDDRLLAFWHACQRHGRPQEAFRRLLQVGLDELMARGEIGARILQEMSDEIALRPPTVEELKDTSKPRRKPAASPSPEPDAPATGEIEDSENGDDWQSDDDEPEAIEEERESGNLDPDRGSQLWEAEASENEAPEVMSTHPSENPENATDAEEGDQDASSTLPPEPEPKPDTPPRKFDFIGDIM
ncbi:hypothetical protein [Roseivivax sp. CAU 1761]